MRNIKIYMMLFICLIMMTTILPRPIAAETVSVEDMLNAMPANEIVAVECSTGKVLFEKNSAETTEISHITKLMLILLVAEKLNSGELSLDDIVSVSANANAMSAPQIWLDVGEKITVDELLKAVTVGNANDAAVALAEHIYDSTEAAVKEMNRKAKELDMNSTTFADVCGTAEQTLSNAADIGILAAELVKFDILTPYFTSWIEYVRDGKAELVNLNRLVRSYKGITGMKACSSVKAGECIVATARKRNMNIAVVVLGCDKRENCDDIAKKLLDMCFESYSLYSPDIEPKMLEDIPVSHGEEKKVPVSFGKLTPEVIPKGSSSSFDIRFQKEDELVAPVKKGQVCGRIRCFYGETEIYSAELFASKAVKENSFKFSLKQLLAYLIKI